MARARDVDEVAAVVVDVDVDVDSVAVDGSAVALFSWLTTIPATIPDSVVVVVVVLVLVEVAGDDSSVLVESI